MNLTHATATCLPCTASTTVRALALSPSGGHLLMFDEDGRALLVNFRRRVVLHHLRFKAPVVQCRFSPNGHFFACVTGKLVQVRPRPRAHRSRPHAPCTPCTGASGARGAQAVIARPDSTAAKGVSQPLGHRVHWRWQPACTSPGRWRQRLALMLVLSQVCQV